MAKYRKKPVVIEAFQYKGLGNWEDASLPEWIWEAFESGVLYAAGGVDPLKVTTMEGDHTVSPDDFLIQGVQGELYACKPDIFAQTYELVEGDNG